MAEKSASALHSGHRARLRERFESSADTFADHELLELLLFYALPRRDTNELAHRLIEECGSLQGVLEAPPEKLQTVCGIKEQSALYLQALGQLAKRYAISKFQPKEDPMKTVYDSAEKLAAVIYPRFLGQTRERMLALLFDSGMHMVDLFTISEGSLNSVPVCIRSLAQRAYQRGAASVVLAHNHPGGIAVPSTEDIKLTHDIEHALRLLGVPLVEHFIFTERNYFPIVANCSIASETDFEHPEAAQFRKLLSGKGTQTS